MRKKFDDTSRFLCLTRLSTIVAVALDSGSLLWITRLKASDDERLLLGEIWRPLSFFLLILRCTHYETLSDGNSRRSLASII